MNITIASGEGGTGKTTFSVNLAYTLADRGDTVRLLDCDVEEPNDHLFVLPEFTEKKPVKVMKPEWDEQLCTGCGECAEAIVFVLCVSRGNPIGYPCPDYANMRDAVIKKLGSDIKIIAGIH